MSPRTRTPRRLGLGLGLVLALGLAACDSGGDIGNTGGFPGEGDAYPDAALQTCDGGATSIESIIAAHDVTYITYAATWCTACQKEAPLLNTDLVDGFDPAKVAVVQILIEDQPGDPPPVSLCAAWRDDLNARYTVLVDPPQVTLPQHFGTAVQTLPLHFIVTRDGTIRFRKLGELPADIADRVADWLPGS
ncbi:MAG: TlpA family protein disulfide reductase [Myxococcales bacterium]|nr:TlpA family protein disulfide reductase [Myxococcales bacterium]MCB9734840.1 TlpA family protein disulfide reductase [Deltaproteobacteria bacterium]